MKFMSKIIVTRAATSLKFLDIEGNLRVCRCFSSLQRSPIEIKASLSNFEGKWLGHFQIFFISEERLEMEAIEGPIRELR